MRPLTLPRTRPAAASDSTRRCAALAIIALSVLAMGCSGYRLGSNKPLELENVTTIAVPTFKNNTLEPRIGTYFTHAVVKELQNDGTYKVADTGTADAILRCSIDRIERSQLRSARFNTLRSRELRVRAFVEYELTEVTTGLVLDRGTVTGDTNVFLDPNFQLTERQAMDEVSRRVATDLVSRIAEGWPGEKSMYRNTDRYGASTDDPRRRAYQSDAIDN